MHTKVNEHEINAQQLQLYWIKPPGEKGSIGRPFLSNAAILTLFDLTNYST